MNPRASVAGMTHVTDCHGDCIDASWYADGTCDDSPISGNFFCEDLFYDGGDCLTDDICDGDNECSMCGSHWNAVNEACPPAGSDKPIPDACDIECGRVFSAWYTGCDEDTSVVALDQELGGALEKFAIICADAAGGSHTSPPPPPRSPPPGGGH